MRETGRLIRILIVDDHAIMRTGLKMLASSRSGHQVVGEAATGREALAEARNTQPDIVLLDLDLGDESGLPLIGELLKAAPEARILVLTGLRDRDALAEAARRGAAGVVRKERAAEVLLDAIDAVAAGEARAESPARSTPSPERLSERRRETDEARRRIATLTRREREVVDLVVRGKSNPQIAVLLCISETTVRHHLTTIYEKLEVAGRVPLVLFAQQHLVGDTSPGAGAEGKSSRQ